MATFSIASMDDLGEIADLIRSLSVGWEGGAQDPGRKGFLLPMATTTDLEAFVRAGSTWLAREGSRLAGFVIVLDWHAPENRATRELMATSRDLGVDLGAQPGLKWIEKVGIARDRIGTGLALELYRQALGTSGVPYSCCIVEKPFFNSASVRFHEKLGFQRVGTFQADTFRGLSPYQSGIYFRGAGWVGSV